MLSLIWKDIREFRFQMVLLVLFGLAYLGLLGLFQSGEKDLDVLGLLAVCGPLFVFIFSMNLLSNERARNTLPFTMGLPLSRISIWFAKLGSNLLFWVFIYAVYGALVYWVGARDIAITTGELEAPSLSFANLMVFYPLLVLSVGMFVTLFIAELRAIVVLGLILAGYYLYDLGRMSTINYPLLCGGLIVVFQGSAFYGFTRGETFDSRATAKRGFTFLGGALAVFFLVWAGLDRYFESHVPQDNLELDSVDYDGSYRSLVLTVSHPPSAMDPIQSERMGRTLLYDMNTGKLEPLFPRETREVKVSPGGRFLVGVSSYEWRGLLGAPRLVIRDKETGRTTQLKGNCSLVGFAPSQNVIFCRVSEDAPGRRKNQFFEVVPETGNRLIFSEDGLVKSFHVPSTNQIFLSGPTGSHLVDVSSGDRKQVSASGSFKLAADFKGGFIIEREDWDFIDTRFGLVLKTGECRMIAEDLNVRQFFGVDFSGRVLAFTEKAEGLASPSLHLSVFSPDTGSFTSLVDFGERVCTDKTGTLDWDRKTALIVVYTTPEEGYKREFLWVNLESGKKEKIDTFSLDHAYSFFGSGPGTFVYRAYRNICEISFPLRMVNQLPLSFSCHSPSVE